MNETNFCEANLTTIQIYTPIVLSGLCLISLIISIPGIIVGLLEFCIKNKVSDQRTERLLLYLAIIAFLSSLIGCFQWIAYFALDSKIASISCSVLSYLWLNLGIAFLVITISIGIHFLIQICQPKILNVLTEEKIRRYRKLEIMYLTATILLAILLSPWPFIDQTFGFNRWICWINVYESNCKSYTTIGFPVIAAFYAATLIGFLLTLLVVVIIQIMICLRKRNKRNLYVWVFTSYLITTLTVFAVALSTNYFKAQKIPLELFAAKCVSIGMLPLIASIATTVAFVHNKILDNNPTIAPIVPQYHSFEDGRTIHRTYSAISRVPTTMWKSPSTDI